MSFLRKNFGPIGGQARKGIGGAPARWAYKTDDAVATVRVAGYFNEVRNLLSIGDSIDVIVVTNLNASNEALSAAHIVIVKDKSSSAVDVTDGTAVSVVDSD